MARGKARLMGAAWGAEVQSGPTVLPYNAEILAGLASQMAN